jgi:hypothetical protein
LRFATIWIVRASPSARSPSPKSSHVSRDVREGAWDHSLDTGRPAATTITALFGGLAIEELTDPGAMPDELFGQLIVRPLSGKKTEHYCASRL